MEAIAIGSAVVGAFGQYKAGKAQQAMYRSQAMWTAIQGEQDAIQFEQQGVNTLKKTLRTMSTITARAAAGNINPWAGSVGNLQDHVLNEGYIDFGISRMNASNKRFTSEFQANTYVAAGKSAYQQGVFGAITTLGTAAGSYGQLGGVSSKPSPSDFAISDKRLKENIVFKEKSPSGINVYEWNYIWNKKRYTGVMAQEIVQSYPNAVMKDKYGYLRVCYDLLDVRMSAV